MCRSFKLQLWDIFTARETSVGGDAMSAPPSCMLPIISSQFCGLLAIFSLLTRKKATPKQDWHGPRWTDNHQVCIFMAKFARCYRSFLQGNAARIGFCSTEFFGSAALLYLGCIGCMPQTSSNHTMMRHDGPFQPCIFNDSEAIVAFGLYEQMDKWGYLLVCGGLAAPLLLQPALLPSLTKESSLPLLQRFCTKANVWIAIFSFLGAAAKRKHGCRVLRSYIMTLLDLLVSSELSGTQVRFALLIDRSFQSTGGSMMFKGMTTGNRMKRPWWELQMDQIVEGP